MTIYTGSAGGDDFDNSTNTTNDSYDMSQGGDDTVIAGSGDDVIFMGATLTAFDHIDGGAGYNTVSLAGDYSAGLALGAGTLVNISQITMAAGGSYKLTINAATVGAGQTLDIDASALSSSDSLNLDGSAVNGGSLIIRGGAGDDVVSMGGAMTSDDSFDGGGGDNTLILDGNYGGTNPTTIRASAQHIEINGNYSYTLTLQSPNQVTIDAKNSGTDIIVAENGLDTFDFTHVGFTAQDEVVGGSDGSIDPYLDGAVLKLGGDYYASGTTFSTNSLEFIGAIELEGGHNYNLTFDNYSANWSVRIDATELSGSDKLTVDDSAQIYDPSAFDDQFICGGGTYDLIGSQNDDLFEFDEATSRLKPQDRIDGQGSSFSGNELWLGGDYSAGLTFQPKTIQNIQDIELSAGFSYKLTMNDGNVAAGQTMTINGSFLTASDALTFDGSDETDGSYHLYPGAGTNTLTGGAQSDLFDFRFQQFTSSDQLNGGGGDDTLDLSGDYSSGLAFGNSIRNIGAIQLDGNFSYKLIMSDANVSAGQTLRVVVNSSTAKPLTFDGSAETDGAFDLECQTGKVTATGGAGNDTFDFFNGFNSLNKIDGGAGSDTVHLWGNIASPITFAAGTLQSVENIVLAPGDSYSLTTNDANLAAGQTMYIWAYELGAGDKLTFNGSAETDGSFYIFGGNGKNILTGGRQGDIFDFRYDTFLATNQINGGGGTNWLYLSGDYSSGLTFGAKTIQNIQEIVLSGGNSYELTTSDANVAANQFLTVNASPLGNSDALTFDGSAEKDGSFDIIAGSGRDKLTGGAGGDVFDFTAGRLTAADAINGGGGFNTLFLGGDYSSLLTFGAKTIQNIQEIVLSGGNDYNLAANDANIAKGKTLQIDASQLTANDHLQFNGGAEKDGSIILYGGAAWFEVVGGANNDEFVFDASNFAGNNEINGGAGSDTLVFDKAGTVKTGALASITGIETIQLADGTNKIALSDNIVTGANKHTLTINGGNGNDTIDGSAVVTSGDALVISPGAGNDRLIGTSGNDSFKFGAEFTATDSVQGGAGTDTISLNGNYAAGATLLASTMVNVEKMTFAGGHSYSFTTNDGNVAKGQTLTVNGSALRSTDELYFNGSHETDGHFVITGGLGGDTLYGGHLSDKFVYTTAAQSSGMRYDTIHGFDFKLDRFDIPGSGSVIKAIDKSLSTGKLDSGTSFDAEMAAALKGKLLPHTAMLFTPGTGSLAHDTFLVIDLNGQSGYQTGHDLVIHLVSATGSLSTADFV